MPIEKAVLDKVKLLLNPCVHEKGEGGYEACRVRRQWWIKLRGNWACWDGWLQQD